MNGYKTYLVSLIPIVFGVLQMTDWNAFLNDPKAGVAALGSGLLMAIMRKVTSITSGV
jgi:hypothetical protein